MKTRLVPRFVSFALGLGLALLSSRAAHATTYPVYTTADFNNLPALAAGDIVVVHNGVYANVSKTLTGSGTAGNPVLVYAESIGGVAFSGSTAITVAGSYVTFAGFKFDGDTAAGGSPSTNKSSILQLASGSDHCTVTNCMIRNYDANAIGGNTYYWFMIRGYNHLIEYNSIEGKTTIGASIVFDMPEGSGTKTTARNHLFRFNYMGPRPVIGANGYEGLRVGVSTLQGYNLASTFEFNYFYRTIYGSGEPEAISNKSSNNIYRYNTFEEVRGQLCLRQGDGCIVEGNFFFGAGLSDAGGVRVIGQNHIVRNNYFQDVDGSGTTSAVVLYKGDVSWPASDDSSGYEAPDNAKIFHNTFVNCAQPIYLGGGSSTKEPTGVEVRNNVVQSAASDGDVFALGMSASLIAFSGDIVYHPSGTYGVTGISGVSYGTNPNLSFNATLGYYVPSSGSAVVDAAANTTPGTSLDVRGLTRPSSGKDIGNYELQATGTGLVPMHRGDVGPAYYGGPADTYIPPGSTVVVPAFSPAGGTYASAQSVTITSATSGATIRYTTDGSTPTATTGTVYSSAVAIAATTTLKAIAYKSGYNNSAVTSAIYTIDDGSVTVSVASGFVNQSFPSQAGWFSVDFDATPSISPSNTTLSLCQGAQTAYTGLACMVRFSTIGNIDARNGGVFAAASTIPFSAGTNYHFRFDVNVLAHTYSVTVTPAGGSATTVGANYAFRTEQAGVTALDNLNIDVNATPGGSVIVSPAVVVTVPAVAAPVFSPAAGTYTSMQSVTITSATSGATIRYTTNGTTPSQSNGTVYGGAVGIAATTTLKAIAYKSGQPDSSVTSATYTITPPAPTKFAILGASVTASADDGNVPANTVDGNLATRWSALGDGQWIQYDLGATKTVSYVRVAWLNGDTRTSTFDVRISTNGTTWTTVLTGAQNPATTALSTFDFADASARYVRIVGHGNSVNLWNSITETEGWGF